MQSYNQADGGSGLGNLQDKQYQRSCYADEVLDGWAKKATVRNLGKSTKVGKSKMAATSTIAYNKVDPKCQKYGRRSTMDHKYIQNPHFQGQGMQW